MSPRTDVACLNSRYLRWRAVVGLILLVAGMAGINGQILAQENEPSLFAPVNLSLSGAASDPVTVPQPGGGLRVFWWDRFDGVTMVEGGLGAWEDPQTTPIVLVEALERPTADGDTVARIPISSMPTIVGDGGGDAHALWLGAVDEETGGHPLLYARLEADETDWSTPGPLAGSATSFSLVGDADGVLHLVYVRDLDTSSAPAGLYYRRSTDGGSTWSTAAAVHTSRYYRLLTAETADLSLIARDGETVFVTWRDPLVGQLLLTGLEDDGPDWREPVEVGRPDAGSQRGRFLSTSDLTDTEVWLLWEETGYGTGCALQQAPVDGLLEGDQEGESVLEGLTSCPEPARTSLLPFGEGETLMVIGSDGGTVTLAVWNGEQWSEPQGLRLDFEDPRREIPVYLNDLQAALLAIPPEEEGADEDEAGANSLAFVGTDEMGDVWIVPRDLEALEMTFAAPSPWSAPVALSESLSDPGVPAVVADEEGRVHALWSELETPEGSTTVLWYARWDRDRWSRATVILSSPEGGARDPTLALSGEYLHALWSGGPNGRIWYSRAFVRDAYASGGWSEPRTLSDSDTLAAVDVAGRPSAVAAAGSLHAVYAVPVNEGRGIFYTASDDGGETWGPPVAVFDAAAEGWATVDDPQLAVDLQGGLHVVWIRPALSADEPSQGVYYAWSRDGGETWSDPLSVAEGAYAWPQVSVNGLNQVHLLWQDVSRDGAWWHRWLGDASSQVGGTEDWAGWGRNEQVIGLRDVAGPLGLAPDGDGRLHVTGLRAGDMSAPALVYVVWDGERWEQQEPQELELEPGKAGAAAALQPEVGRLDIVFGARAPTAEGTPQTELWHTGREVTPAAAIRVVLPEEPVTPTPSPTSTPEPLVSPTPDLRDGPPPAGATSPLPFSTSVFLAGGLAALIVAGAFGVRLLGHGRRGWPWSREESTDG